MAASSPALELGLALLHERSAAFRVVRAGEACVHDPLHERLVALGGVLQQLAHDANLLFYGSEEAKEGREAFKAKRAPDFSRFPRRA